MSLKADVFASRSAKMILSSGMDAQVLHRHRPVELICALDGPIELVSEGGVRHEADCFLVPPMHEHALSASDGRLARTYVDIGHRKLGVWKRSAVLTASADDEALVVRLRDFYRSARDAGSAASIIEAWLDSWPIRGRDAPACDARVAKVLAHLDDGDGNMRCDRHSIAALVGLSPSRLAALFVADTGVPLRRYLIWRRVKAALTLICAGRSVTDAALEAGFTDGAHLTRCCRATYGCKPSSAAGRNVMLVGDALQASTAARVCLDAASSGAAVPS